MMQKQLANKKKLIKGHATLLAQNREVEEQLAEANEELDILRKKMEKYWNLESKHKKSSELAEKRQKLLRKLEKD